MSDNLSPYQVLASCPCCAQARQHAAELMACERSTHGVRVTCRLAGPPHPDCLNRYLVVESLAIVCDRCHSTGQVLTDAARAVVQQMQDMGILTAQQADAAGSLGDAPRAADQAPF